MRLHLILLLPLVLLLVACDRGSPQVATGLSTIAPTAPPPAILTPFRNPAPNSDPTTVPTIAESAPPRNTDAPESPTGTIWLLANGQLYTLDVATGAVEIIASPKSERHTLAATGSPAGRFVVYWNVVPLEGFLSTAPEDVELKLLDMHTREERDLFALRNLATLYEEYDYTAVAFTPNDHYLLIFVQAANPAVRGNPLDIVATYVVDVPSGNIVAGPTTGLQACNVVARSPRTGGLAVWCRLERAGYASFLVLEPDGSRWESDSPPATKIAERRYTFGSDWSWRRDGRAVSFVPEGAADTITIAHEDVQDLVYIPGAVGALVNPLAPDGRYLAAHDPCRFSDDVCVEVHNLDIGEVIWRWDDSHQLNARARHWSPDGRYLAITAPEPEPRLVVIDKQSWRVTITFAMPGVANTLAWTTPSVSSSLDAAPSLTPSGTAALPATEPTAQLTTTAVPKLPDIATLTGPVLATIHAGIETFELYVTDLGTGRLYRHQPSRRPVGVQWLAAACTLTVRTSHTPPNLHTLAIETVADEPQILYEEQVTLPYEDGAVRTGEQQLNADGTLLATLLLSGQPDYELWEFQNLSIAPLLPDGTAGTPFPLTTNGGVHSFAWSPDGRHLAYSDRDSAGIRQLFVYDVTAGTTRQWTAFTSASFASDSIAFTSLSRPVWSPSGGIILFEYAAASLDSDAVHSLWAVNRLAGTLTHLLPASDDGFDIMGISGDERVAAVYAARGRQAPYLHWIDLATGLSIRALAGGIVREHDLWLIAAVDGANGWLGQDSDGRHFTYHFNTGALAPLPPLPFRPLQSPLALDEPNRGEILAGDLARWTLFTPCPP